MSNLSVSYPHLQEGFQVFNPYLANYPLTLWRAPLNDREQSLLRVQMELTAHVIGSRWPYHSKDAHAPQRGIHTSSIPLVTSAQRRLCVRGNRPAFSWVDWLKPIWFTWHPHRVCVRIHTCLSVAVEKEAAAVNEGWSFPNKTPFSEQVKQRESWDSVKR